MVLVVIRSKRIDCCWRNKNKNFSPVEGVDVTKANKNK